MLNRRILRTKAFKTIYSYAENPEMSLKEAEASLELSCEATRDLYLFMLSVIVPLTDEAYSRMEAARSKFNPTEAELHPNTKFVDNRITPLLREDPDFRKILKRKKLSWESYDVLLRQLYETIKGRKYFTDYLESPEHSLEEDASLWAKIFAREFEDNDSLSDILEDMSIYWNDDLGYVLNLCRRTVLDFADGVRWSLPPLYRSDMEEFKNLESDKKFVTNLVRTAYVGFKTFCDEVSSLTPQWTLDRLCTTDLVLIVCGMAEAKSEPSTSSKIIINEYVEISKYYSTPDSSGFVNGLLDKLINKNSEQNV